MQIKATAENQATWQDVFTGSDIADRIAQGVEEHLHFARRYSRYIEIATSTNDVDRTLARGKIAMLLMLKSGWINNDLAVSKQYFNWGIRVMALCHLAPLTWANSNDSGSENKGLSDFGRRVVLECNDLGILHDLSHTSDHTCWDTLAVSKKTSHHYTLKVPLHQQEFTRHLG